MVFKRRFKKRTFRKRSFGRRSRGGFRKRFKKTSYDGVYYMACHTARTINTAAAGTAFATVGWGQSGTDSGNNFFLSGNDEFIRGSS